MPPRATRDGNDLTFSVGLDLTQLEREARKAEQIIARSNQRMQQSIRQSNQRMQTAVVNAQSAAGFPGMVGPGGMPGLSGVPLGPGGAPMMGGQPSGGGMRPPLIFAKPPTLSPAARANVFGANRFGQRGLIGAGRDAFSIGRSVGRFGAPGIIAAGSIGAPLKFFQKQQEQLEQNRQAMEHSGRMATHGAAGFRGAAAIGRFLRRTAEGTFGSEMFDPTSDRERGLVSGAFNFLTSGSAQKAELERTRQIVDSLKKIEENTREFNDMGGNVVRNMAEAPLRVG